MAEITHTDEEFVSEAGELVTQAQKIGIPLRIMAGCAVRIHCRRSEELHKTKMKRNIRDIDFAGLSKYKTETKKLLNELGYEFELAMLNMERDIYHNKSKEMTVDIFYDKLDMCHLIDFQERLERDFPTLSLADLLLHKLQIVEVNERDVKDIIVMLLEHEIGETDKETVDMNYFARLLANEWGFYYTTTTNLKKTADNAKVRYQSILSSDDVANLQWKIDKMLCRIDKEPKSMKWKMRSKIGTKTIWYKEVEEKERGTLADYLIRKQMEQAKK